MAEGCYLVPVSLVLQTCLKTDKIVGFQRAEKVCLKEERNSTALAADMALVGSSMNLAMK